MVPEGERQVSRAQDFQDGTGSLSDDDAALLAFESRRYRYEGAKLEAARNELGVKPTRYYQRLSTIIDNPVSVVHNNGEFAPLVNRLRSKRERLLAARNRKA